MESLTLFKWHNTDYHYIREEPGEMSVSPLIKLNDSEAKFRLILPHESEEEGEFCPLWLRLDDFGGEKSINVQFRLWIESPDGTKLMENPLERTCSFFYEYQEEGDELFITHDRLFSPELGFERNGSITFCCQILHIKPNSKSSDFEFHEKTYSLYEAGVSGDCILKVGTHEFKVPKNILMAGSDVFDRMFASNTQESKTGVVKLEGVSVEIVKKFIKYLHLGNHMNELDKFAEELFIFADRYIVRNLIDICMNHMAKTFSKENIVRRLQIAFFYNIPELKSRALFYITDYSSKVNFISILESAAWMKLVHEDPIVANDIVIACFNLIKSL